MFQNMFEGKILFWQVSHWIFEFLQEPLQEALEHICMSQSPNMYYLWIRFIEYTATNVFWAFGLRSTAYFGKLFFVFYPFLGGLQNSQKHTYLNLTVHKSHCWSKTAISPCINNFRPFRTGWGQNIFRRVFYSLFYCLADYFTNEVKSMYSWNILQFEISNSKTKKLYRDTTIPRDLPYY